MKLATELSLRRVALTGALTVAMPQLAFAHHAMGGGVPSTFFEGLMSGLAHPVIGPDHLAFVIGVGMMMAASRRWMLLPAAFVALLVPGVLAHVAGVSIGGSELHVALSVVVLGIALMFERTLPALLGIAAVALAGFSHGYAFGESIVGAETTPLVAYLAGLALVTGAMMMVIAAATRALTADGTVSLGRFKAAAGAVLVAVGGVASVLALGA